MTAERLRRDWWRFWFATIPDNLARHAVSVTVRGEELGGGIRAHLGASS